MQANVAYFKAVVNLKPHDIESIHKTRLARKYSHQQLAALSEAIQAAQIEPFGKTFNWPLINRVQLLSYQLNVLTATFAGTQKNGVSHLTENDITLVTEKLKEAQSFGGKLNLHHTAPVQPNGYEQMSLLAVSANLSTLVKTNVS